MTTSQKTYMRSVTAMRKSKSRLELRVGLRAWSQNAVGRSKFRSRTGSASFARRRVLTTLTAEKQTPEVIAQVPARPTPSSSPASPVGPKLEKVPFAVRPRSGFRLSIRKEMGPLANLRPAAVFADAPG